MLKSKYETWDKINPYVNPEERKVLDYETLSEYEKNIFKKSKIPIVRHKRKINYSIYTTAFLEPGLQYAKSVRDYYSYTLNAFDILCAKIEFKKLAFLLVKMGIPFWYGFNFPSSKWKKNTRLFYNYEKNEFNLETYYEAKRMRVSRINIIYKEDGSIKSATISKSLRKGPAVSKFKGYKTGFELYMVTYGGSIIYRRKL